MAPACSKFPRMEFFDGKGLKDSDEVNGTSLVNHANAGVVVDMIDRLILTKVVKAGMIKVLTYYQGQRRLMRQLLDSRPWDRDLKDAIEISTVDSFQGRERQSSCFAVRNFRCLALGRAG